MIIQAELENCHLFRNQTVVSIPGGSIALRSGAGVLSNFEAGSEPQVGRPHRWPAFLVSNQAE